MKVFVAGATGVLGRATVPRLVTAGHEVSGTARSTEKAVKLREQGAEAIDVDLFDVASVRAAVDDCDAVVHMATHIPRLSKAWRANAWAANDTPTPRGHGPPGERRDRRRRDPFREGVGVLLLRRTGRLRGSTRTVRSMRSHSAQPVSTPSAPPSPSPTRSHRASRCVSACSTAPTPGRSTRA